MRLLTGLMGLLVSAVVAYPQYGFEPEYCVRRRARQEAHHHQQQRRGRAELDDYVSQALSREPDYTPHRFRQSAAEYAEVAAPPRQPADLLCQEHPEMCRPRVRVERVIYVDYPPELEGYYVAPPGLYRRAKKRTSLERPPAAVTALDGEGPRLPAPGEVATRARDVVAVEAAPEEPGPQLSRREAAEEMSADPGAATEPVAMQRSE